MKTITVYSNGQAYIFGVKFVRYRLFVCLFVFPFMHFSLTRTAVGWVNFVRFRCVFVLDRSDSLAGRMALDCGQLIVLEVVRFLFWSGRHTVGNRPLVIA